MSEHDDPLVDPRMGRMTDACTAACLLGRHYHPDPWTSIPAPVTDPTPADPLVALLHKHGIGCHPTAERGDFRHHEAAAYWLRAEGMGPLEAEDLATVICHREHRTGMVWCTRHRDEAEGIIADLARIRENR